MNRLLAFLGPVIIAACGTPAPAPADPVPSTNIPADTMDEPRHATTQAPPADALRDERERPDVVIDLMKKGFRPQDAVIADLFARDGYYTFKLIEAGAKVIAVVNTAEEAEALERRKQLAGLTDDRLTIRAVAVGEPGLGPGEADLALMVDGFNTLHDQTTYFNRMRNGLRYPRPLFLVERRPTVTTRMTPEENPMLAMQQRMLELGYSEVGAYGDKIPSRVIVVATDPTEE